PRSKGIGHLVLGSLCNSGRQPIRSPVECASILRTPSLTAAERLVRRDLREARGRLDYRGAARPSPTLWKAEMPESAPVSSRARQAMFRAAVLITVVILLLCAVLVVRWAESEDPEGIASPTPTIASSPPPFPVAPVSTVDDVTLTVPEESRFAHGTFWAEAGATYLVTMDLESVKPEGSGGRSMYLGVTLSCSPQAGGPGISVGGTQNMLTGEETLYSNQGIISIPEDGAIDCSIKTSAPYDDVASDGTTFQIDGTWRVEAVDGDALDAPEDGLPRTIADGSGDVVKIGRASCREREMHPVGQGHGRTRECTTT